MPGQTECHLVPVRSQFANSPPSTASPSSAMFFFFFFEHDSGRVDAKRDNLVKPVETRRAAPGSHAPTHPRKRPSHIHARAQPNAELIVGAWVPGCLGAWVPGCLGGLLAAPGHRGGSNRGSPESSASQKAIYQESYFPQRGCDNDRRRTARLTSDVENMPVRAENSFASASACCCSSSISSIVIGSWRVHEAQGTSFFSGRQPRGTSSGTETGTGKIQEQGKFRNRCGVCIHSGRTICHFLLPRRPTPMPTPPNCFSLFADDHQPRLAERYSPPTPPPLSRLPSYGPSIGRHGARVCFPRIHTDPCHLADGRRRETKEEKKGRTRHLDLEWTAGPPPILTSPAWTTRKTSHTSMSPRWTSSGPTIATEGGWECKVRTPPPPSRRACVHPASPLSKSARLRDLPDRDWDWALDQPFAQSPWSPFRDELVAKTAAAGLPLSLIARPRPSVSLPSGQPAPRPALRVPDAATAGHRW